VRSVELVLGGALVLLLSGCVTTQQRNERAKLRAEREIGSRQALRVGAPHPEVDVTAVALVRTRASSAVVVDLRSRANTPLTDLPIAVGARTRDGRDIPLNDAQRLDWFETHVAALAPSGSTTWVCTVGRRLPAGARPYARVGLPGPPALSRAGRLPALQASALPDGRVRVRNDSGVPQDDLPVYAVAREAGRYVAAGRASIARLEGGDEATVAVRLVGRTGAAAPHVHALPTIFE
jgi:hypothetical protein